MCLDDPGGEIEFSFFQEVCMVHNWKAKNLPRHFKVICCGSSSSIFNSEGLLANLLHASKELRLRANVDELTFNTMGKCSDLMA